MVRKIKQRTRDLTISGEIFKLECGHIIIAPNIDIYHSKYIKAINCQECIKAQSLPNTLTEIAEVYWHGRIPKF